MRFPPLLTFGLVFTCMCVLAKPKTRVFSELVESNYHFQVFEWNGEAENVLREVADATCLEFNQKDQFFDRTNEVGIEIERILEEQFVKREVKCEAPRTLSGRKQNGGYPDLAFELDGANFYLEVKVFSSDTISSTQRTFYFSVSDDPKIVRDAFHLLIGFELEKKDDSDYRILQYHVRDLRYLPCKVKVEYNASNKSLYGEEARGYQFSSSTSTNGSSP